MWSACFKCRYFRGLSINGVVECEACGKTEPKLLCTLFEPKQRGGRKGEKGE